DGKDRALRSDVTESRELSAEGVHVGVQDALCEGRRDRGIEGIPARVKYAQAGLGREIVLRHHHAAGAHQRWSLRHRLSFSRVTRSDPARFHGKLKCDALLESNPAVSAWLRPFAPDST